MTVLLSPLLSVRSGGSPRRATATAAAALLLLLMVLCPQLCACECSGMACYTPAQQGNTSIFLRTLFDSLYRSSSSLVPPTSDDFCTWPGVTCSSVGVLVEGIQGRVYGSLNTIPDNVTGSEVVVIEVKVAGMVDLWGVFPESWGILSNLQTLWIESLSFGADIPRSFVGLKSLKIFRVVNSPLSGTLPAEWSALTHLTWFDVNNTEVEGTIPSSWSAMTSLTIFDVSNTRVSGILPHSWSALTSMTEFFGRSSRLEGPLPESWGAMTSLRVFDVTRNQLTGTIPESWYAMKELTRVSLAENNLTGCLPHTWVCHNGLTTASVGLVSAQSQACNGKNVVCLQSATPSPPQTTSRPVKGPSSSAVAVTAHLALLCTAVYVTLGVWM